MLRILSIDAVLYEKYMNAQTGKATNEKKNFFVLVNLLKFESDIKGHSNNEVVINFGKQNFTSYNITYSCEN